MGRKERFSTLDVLALSRELGSLGRARFDKAHGLDGDRYVLTFRVQGEGRKDLLVVPGKFAAFLAGAVERPAEPGPFASEMRRLLSGAILSQVVQPGGERLLELSFSRVSEPAPMLLVIELFHPGNMLVVKEGQIVAVASPRTWAHRTVRVGAPYARPPTRADPSLLKVGEAANALSGSTTNLVTSLATKLSLGGPLAEEVLVRTGRSGSGPASEEPDAVAREVVTELTKIRGEITDPPRGFLYRKEGEEDALDVEPFASRRWSADPQVKEEPFPTFSAAVIGFFGTELPPPPTPEDRERSRLERLRAQQEKVVESVSAAVQTLQRSADALLIHFGEAEEAVRKAQAEDPEVEKVTVTAGEVTVEIKARLPVRQSAQALYDEAKRMQAKLEGAKNALRETERAAARLAPGTLRSPSSPTSPGARPRRTKHFWFEKSPRWLLTSGGFAAVAGKDARTNDWVVKRNLRPEDIYIHADVHGAPSVVVRCTAGNAPVGAELEQICQWAVCFSKAWRAGHASADAFWVRGDQVTKAGASGEFVPAGAWVIHGTKNFLKDLPLELGVGEVRWEGEVLLMAGPPSAFTGPGRRLLWSLRPGREDARREAERELSRSLGCSLETVQSMLPGGGLDLRRV